jgi:dTDP-4-dehydrorhamnose reductase
MRIQWLFGKNGKNFVKTMLSLAKNNPSLKVVNDQFGSPTYTRDVAAAIGALIKTEAYGLYHVTNAGHCSWHRFAQDIMEIAGLSTPVIPCATAEFPRPAQRPAFSVLDNTYFQACGFEPLRHYKEALREYLKELKEEPH